MMIALLSRTNILQAERRGQRAAFLGVFFDLRLSQYHLNSVRTEAKLSEATK